MSRGSGLKIDPGLVAWLPHAPRARAVVQALVEVCPVLGVRVSPTGVSTPDRLAAVRDHGVPWAQGADLVQEAAGVRRLPEAP